MNQAELARPGAPRVCVRCGHGECPYCSGWCDMLVPEDDPDDLCCDGRCVYESDWGIGTGGRGGSR